MSVLSKSLHPDDYEELKDAIGVISYGTSICRGMGHRIYFPHENRMWEYASAVHALDEERPKEARETIEVLDVGGGWGALGPSLLLQEQDLRVTELELDPGIVEGRKKLREEVTGLHGLRPAVGDITQNLRADQQFFAVFCISVMEHLTPEEQTDAWKRLARMVSPGGLLFATVDYGDDPHRPWDNDTERETKFHPWAIQEVAKTLREEGLELEVDTTYHGDQVFNYSFFRIAARRPA